MAPFQKEKEAIIDILSNAHQQIDQINNAEIHWLKHKVLTDIKKHIDAVKSQIGEPVAAALSASAKPLTKMFGKSLNPESRPVAGPAVQSAQIEGIELKAKVDELWPRFLAGEPDQLLDSLTDIEIRGVAKKAGLPVTETEPKRITTEFVQQIKEALQKQVNPEEGDPNTKDEGDKGPIKTANESDVEQLREEVNKLYDNFGTLKNADIIENFSGMAIRGVAKKAGMVVTETDPEELDAKFLTKVRGEIKKKAEIENDA